MKVHTAQSLAADLRARIKRDGQNATAQALGIWRTTLCRFVDGGEPYAALLHALKLQRAYRNGSSRPESAAEVRLRARLLVERHGGYRKAAEAIGVNYSTLYQFVQSEGDLPESGVIAAMGYQVVYVAKGER